MVQEIKLKKLEFLLLFIGPYYVLGKIGTKYSFNGYNSILR